MGTLADRSICCADGSLKSFTNFLKTGRKSAKDYVTQVVIISVPHSANAAFMHMSLTICMISFHRERCQKEEIRYLFSYL